MESKDRLILDVPGSKKNTLLSFKSFKSREFWDASWTDLEMLTVIFVKGMLLPKQYLYANFFSFFFLIQWKKTRTSVIFFSHFIPACEIPLLFLWHIREEISTNWSKLQQINSKEILSPDHLFQQLYSNNILLLKYLTYFGHVVYLYNLPLCRHPKALSQQPQHTRSCYIRDAI